MAATVTPKITSPTPPQGSQWIKAEVTGGSDYARITRTRASAKTNYVHQWMRIASHSLAADEEFRTLRMLDSSNNVACEIRLWNDSGTLKWQARFYDDDEAGDFHETTGRSITVGSTDYLIELKYDTDGGAWEARENGATTESGSLSSNIRLPNKMRTLIDACTSVSGGVAAYFDEPKWDTAGWIGATRKVISEALGISDSFFRILDAQRLLSDNAGVTDTHVTQMICERLLSAAVDLTDSRIIARGFGRLFSDSLGTTDVSIASSVLTRLLSDAQAPTDAVAAFSAIIKRISENLGLTDAYTHLLTLVVALAESLGITDARTTLTIMSRMLSETIAPNDSSSEGGVDFVDTDVVFIDTDTVFQDTGYVSYVIPTVTFQRYQAEAEGLADAMDHTAQYFRDVSDDMGMTDALVDILYLLIIKKLSESLGITDSRIALRIMAHIFSDNAGITDARIRIATYVRFLANIEGLTDAAARYADFDRKVSDTEGQTDVTALFADLARLLSENEGITDTVVDAIVATMIERLLSDDAGISDAKVDTLFAMFWELISDTGAVSDQLSAIKTIIRVVSEAGGITDGLTYQQDFIRRIKNTEGLTDAVKHVFTIAKRIADSIGLSDLALGNILAYALYKLILLGSQDYMQITPTAAELMAITVEPQDLIQFTMTTFDSEVAA